jgi:phage-related protein (TIGR01555 family)
MRKNKKRTFKTSDAMVTDGFANFNSRLGVGAVDNNLSQGHYQPNLLTRNRLQLENAYRGNWIVGNIVDAIAEDMTRAKIELRHAGDPSESSEMERAFTRMGIWGDIAEAIKWSRLYGGAITVMIIEGQDLSTPLNMDTIAKGAFKGLVTYDRWQLQPSLDDLIRVEEGAEAGMPRYYSIVNNITSGIDATLGAKIHYSRVIRFTGIQLPYFQAITEMFWGESIIERLFDRLISFDTATMGAANLVDRAYLRTIGVDGLREILAAGGKAEEGLISMFSYMRMLQNNEGLTLTDKNDNFQTHSYTFSGVTDIILQFGQQLAGASGIPLVRLFGQSPSGMSATGESDMRMYYDTILSKQESMLREGVQRIISATYRSLYGKPIPTDTTFEFQSLWQMSAIDKSTIANNITTAITTAYQAGILNDATALKELKQSSEITGIYTNVTDEQIEEAENMPPMPMVENESIEESPINETGDSISWTDKIKQWLR